MIRYRTYAAVFVFEPFRRKPGIHRKVALERFIQAGGGFAGIHPTAKTFNWRWYGRMIGSEGDSGVSFIHQKYDGGQGHLPATTAWMAKKVSDDAVLKNVLNGIEYAIGHFKPLDYSRATIAYPPAENHFTKQSLVQGTFFEPTEMTILPNLNILILQRRGEIMLYKQATGQVKQAGFLTSIGRQKQRMSMRRKACWVFPRIPILRIITGYIFIIVRQIVP